MVVDENLDDGIVGKLWATFQPALQLVPDRTGGLAYSDFVYVGVGENVGGI